ncbi:hypothetical protein KO465_04935 [Candidatus Micrarchaeota archaeon]|nr:hypothetical protein [Candidatus Micrarchaeota archaeon]
MKRFKAELVVTQHPALVEYLKELDLVEEDVRVIEHAEPEDVRKLHVIGVLPHSLSSLTASFTEIPLRLTPEMRRKELDLQTLREIAGDPATYLVVKLGVK